MEDVVRPTGEVRAELSQITRRFDAGEDRPVFFGAHRRAQAVLVPIATWERLQEKVEAASDDVSPTSAGAGRYRSMKPYAPPPSDMATLRGKASGTIRLPRHLDWSPGRFYDLENARQRRALNEVVLQEAASTAEVEEYVNAQLLTLDWPSLRLPPRLCIAWERQLPSLATTA